MRSTSIPEVPIELDRDSHLSLPLQLARAVRQLIDEGVLLPGDELPSTRAWASRLGVSRGTVVSAYEQLTAEGYLAGERGSATRINPRLRQTHPTGVAASRGSLTTERGGAAELGRITDTTERSSPGTQRSMATQPTHPLAPTGIARRLTGRPTASPDTSSLGAATSVSSPADMTPLSAPPTDTTPAGAPPIDMLPGRPATDWLRTPAWRRAWRNAADAEILPLPPEGSPEFLANVAEHFRRMRGLAREANEFLVTAGGREGLALIIQTLGAELNHARPVRVGVESPGYPSLGRTAQTLGAELLPLEVDREGLQTSLLPSGFARPDLVIVTPSHQYPIGGSLPIDRRLELLEWARRERVLIVEDDYDSELRYVGQPLPTLTALDDSRTGTVALLGTFSTTVAPSLGVGMLCVSDYLRERLLATRQDLGTPVSAVVQHAFAEYLESGELRRHTARMRRTYRQRRGLVLEALGQLPGVAVSPMDGGLHAVIHGDRSEDALLTSCARAGVLVAPGAEYWRGPSSVNALDSSGGSVLIGYAHLSEDALREGLSRLRSALAA